MEIVASKEELVALKKTLEQFQKKGISLKAFVGFDGFIDKIQKAIKKKSDGQTIFFSTIKEFSDHMHSLAGHSGQVELLTTRVKAGGNAPLLSIALGELGITSFCVGSMGFPEAHPIFQPMASSVELLSVIAPGSSQAIEFNDGKIILSDLSSFSDYDWNYIKENFGTTKISSAVNSSDLIALVDWANLPNSTHLWRGFLNDVIKFTKKKGLIFLFDICDPSKRSSTEIKELLILMNDYTEYGSVTLAVNENEALKIWMSLNDLENEQETMPSLTEIGSFIFTKLSIDTLLIHPIDRTLVFQKYQTIEMKGRVVTDPKVLTGGGDNLNAGYSLGLMKGLNISQCMLLSMITSGAFVENGKSPKIEDLIDYLNSWVDEINQLE
jgi:hypothetical protein